MTGAVETPIADYTRKYADWAGDIAGLWLPGAGIVAKIIAKAPLAELERYLRGRARGGHLVEILEIAAPPTVEVPNTPLGSGNKVLSIVTTPPEASPAPTTFEVADLLRQYEAVQESEPFRVALGRTLQIAVTQLETFMQETARFASVQKDTGNGLWPAFAIEWKLRRVFADRLGAAAIVADHPALRSLIQADLAAGLVDALMAAPDPTPEHPRKIRQLVRVFASDRSYRWPRAEGFRSGYVLAAVSSPLASSPITNLARSIGADTIDEAQAKQDAVLLIDRLARLSACGRDELTTAWLRNCEVSGISKSQREGLGISLNPFLSRLEHPLIHIDRAELLDAIRDDGEVCVGVRKHTEQFGETSLYAVVNKLSEAYAIHDDAAFSKAAIILTALMVLPPNRAIAEHVGRFIERLKQERGW